MIIFGYAIQEKSLRPKEGKRSKKEQRYYQLNHAIKNLTEITKKHADRQLFSSNEITSSQYVPKTLVNCKSDDGPVKVSLHRKFKDRLEL